MKKFLAIALVAVMMMAMIPVTAAAETIDFEDEVEVFNIGTGGFSYDPNSSTKSTIYITGPYDRISTSSVPSSGKYGVNYAVKFFLDGEIDLKNDIVYLGGSKMDNETNNRGKLEVFNRSIICYFTAERGGNEQTFSLRVYDDTTEKTTRKSVTIVYRDTSDGSSSGSGSNNYVSGDMTVDAYAASNYYNVWTNDGVIYIDYDGVNYRTGSLLDVTFRFEDDEGDRIPYSGSAQLYDVTSNGVSSFLYAPSSARTFRTQLVASLSIDPSNTRVRFEVLYDGDIYRSGSYYVVWNDISKGTVPGTGVLNILPSRSPSITVGQDYTFTITSNNIYNTGSYFTLDVSGTSNVVTTATGKYLTIRGVAPGTTWLNVRNSSGTVLDTISVTVTSSGSTGSTGGVGTYRVTANSLNVRSGPGTGYPILGKLGFGSQVTVNSLGGGWANIAWGSGSSAYVSMSYLAFVSGPITQLPAPPSGGTSGDSSSSTGNSSGGLTGSGSSSGSGSGLGGSSYGGYYGYMQVRVNWTSVQDGPGRGYGEIDLAEYGDIVEVYGIFDGWAYVDWYGTMGYINASHLRSY